MNLNPLDYLGIDLTDPNIPKEVLFSLSMFILLSISILTFVNLMVYFIILRIAETEIVQIFIKNKPFLQKLVKIYKYTSAFTIVTEIGLFIYANSHMLYFNIKIINHYFQII